MTYMNLFCEIKKLDIILENYDGLIIDKFGPMEFQSSKNFSLRAVKLKTGFIYQYAFIMLL